MKQLLLILLCVGLYFSGYSQRKQVEDSTDTYRATYWGHYTQGDTLYYWRYRVKINNNPFAISYPARITVWYSYHGISAPINREPFHGLWCNQNVSACPEDNFSNILSKAKKAAK